MYGFSWKLLFRAKAKVLGTESNDSVEVNGRNGKTYHYKPKPAVSVAEDAPEKTADRKATRGGCKKVATPEVGVSLTPAEILGKAYSLLLEAEKLGITPDCTDILNKIFSKTTALVEKVGTS